MRLIELIETFEEKRYSNELDVIYALLGLFRPENDIKIEVNYTISLDDLLITISHEYLLIGILGILRMAGKKRPIPNQGNGNQGVSHLPSWVCDFRTPRGRLALRAHRSKQKSVKRQVTTVHKRDILPIIGIQGSMNDTVKLIVDTGALPQDENARCSFMLKHI